MLCINGTQTSDKTYHMSGNLLFTLFIVFFHNLRKYWWNLHKWTKAKSSPLRFIFLISILEMWLNFGWTILQGYVKFEHIKFCFEIANKTDNTKDACPCRCSPNRWWQCITYSPETRDNEWKLKMWMYGPILTLNNKTGSTNEYWLVVDCYLLSFRWTLSKLVHSSLIYRSYLVDLQYWCGWRSCIQD